MACVPTFKCVGLCGNTSTYICRSYSNVHVDLLCYRYNQCFPPDPLSTLPFHFPPYVFANTSCKYPPIPGHSKQPTHPPTPTYTMRSTHPPTPHTVLHTLPIPYMVYHIHPICLNLYLHTAHAPQALVGHGQHTKD